jgi:hypothetical protein
MSETSIKPDELRNAADELENLVTPEVKQVFTDITAFRPHAGNFDAAAWIEDRVYDRRAALLRHVEDIEFACAGLADTMRNVATTIEGLDDVGAQEDAFRYQADEWVSRMEDRDTPAARAPQMGDDDTYRSGDTGSTADRPVIDYTVEDGKVKIDVNAVDYVDPTWEDKARGVFERAADEVGDDMVTVYGGGMFRDDLDLNEPTEYVVDPTKDA